MPFVHTSTFRIRHYECDAHGKLHPAQFLRYMQEAAFAASDAVGYGAHTTQSLGLQWFAYETEVNYLRPVSYGETITIKTWIHDFRRVRSLRRYEIYVGDEKVVEASTDWVLINTKTNYPTTIQQEIITAYARGEPTEQASTRPPFMRMPETPENAFTVNHHVAWHDIDPARHVNNAVYVYYVREAELQAQKHVGWSSDTLDIMTTQHQIEYKFPAMWNDTLTLTTWLTDLNDTSGLRYTIISRAEDGKLLTRIRTLWTCRDRQSGLTVSIPADLRATFAPHILG